MTGGGDIPVNAVIVGNASDGEPLYVGRVNHNGGLVIGKVQASQRVCSIGDAGEEQAYADYEILVLR